MKLHLLWITRCNLIYIKTTEEVAIEELNDLCNEVKELLFDQTFQEILIKVKSKIPTNIDDLPTLKLKKLLF